MIRDVQKVCVYCASSRKADGVYLGAAKTLGRLLAEHHITLVYGGSSAGAMGAVADGALAAGSHVVGVLPRFMHELKWGHKGLSELLLVDDLHARKRMMIEEVDAIVALPGGSGTLEELLEAITWKRLGLYLNPIVLVNIRGFFDPLVALFDQAIAENFMDERHRLMWSVVERAEDVIKGIQSASDWSPAARTFAVV